jgi:hypothetical protein
MSATLIDPPPWAYWPSVGDHRADHEFRTRCSVSRMCLALRAWPWALGFVLAALIADVVLHLGAAGRVTCDVAAGAPVLGAAAGAWAVRVRNLVRACRSGTEQRDAQLARS